MGTSVTPHDPVVAGLTLDSRKVQPGYLFAALAGSKSDGATFIDDAVKRGATVILAPSDSVFPQLARGIVAVPDDNPRRRIALMPATLPGAQPKTIPAVTA